MDDDYWAIRQRVHRKSHEYFFFEFRRWDREKRNMFYGATDALADAGMAASGYEGAISSNESANLLACYGFLQALYVQQDAVVALSRALGLKWNPNDDPRLKEIREARNRLTGHPALSERSRASSAIIPYHSINTDGFRGHVYYESASEDIVVDVKKFRADNQQRLAVQMMVVEQQMDGEEQRLRNENSKQPLSSAFGVNFDYLMQRLHTDLTDLGRVGQSQVHASMIRERLDALQSEMTSRGFLPDGDSLRVIRTGLDLLESILNSGVATERQQDEYQLLYDGLQKAISSLRDSVEAIDAKLATPVVPDPM